VLVAVSGGADSVALLHALSRLGAELDWRLAVGHVHHGLRSEADADARFVEGLAADLDCPVSVERVAVAEGGGSLEAAARDARYAALGRMASAFGADRIALGHTQDDQSETVLMRLLQGAGPRGVAGIPPRRGRLVRPLLGVDRVTVLGYLLAQGLRWVEDATNRDPKFLRNRIRHDLLPLLIDHLGPGLRRALGRTATAARETVVALDALVVPRLSGRLRPAVGGAVLDLGVLAGLPAGAAKALLRLAVRAAVPDGPLRSGLRRPHLEALWRLPSAAPGARVRLPGGAFAERVRDGLWIGRCPVGWPAGTLTVPGRLRLESVGLEVTADVVPPAAGRPDDPAWEVWFDEDILSGGLSVRPCRPGERVVPFGAPGPVHVSRLLAAGGTPRLTRGEWPVLVAGSGETIAWVIGLRRAAGAPVTLASRAMVRIRAAPSALLDPNREALS
jgi:tRNA(Ile)-lysidine synthase